MDKNTVIPSYLKRRLPDSLEEWCGLNISYGAAYLGYDDVGVTALADAVKPFLYLVGDMWNDLDRASEIVSPSFLIQYCPVYLSGSDIGIYRQVLVNKSLVMSQVKVGLGTVLGHKDLAVLIRGHSTRINIYIGIELLYSDTAAASFKQSSQRGCGDALAESGNDSSCDKHVFSRHIYSSIFFLMAFQLSFSSITACAAALFVMQLSIASFSI